MTNKCKQIRDYYWLIVDKTITQEQLKSYQDHLEICPECRAYASDFGDLDNELSILPLYDLNENSYRNMITKLPSRRKWLSILHSKESSTERNYVRFAFTGAVVIITIALLILFNSEEPLKQISKPVFSLDWKAEKIENNFHKIDSSIITIRTKDVRSYLVQEDAWKSDVYLLARDIERMQAELNKSTL